MELKNTVLFLGLLQLLEDLTLQTAYIKSFASFLRILLSRNLLEMPKIAVILVNYEVNSVNYVMLWFSHVTLLNFHFKLQSFQNLGIWYSCLGDSETFQQ